MADPTTQSIQEQIRQAQQSALAQTAAQQQQAQSAYPGQSSPAQPSTLPPQAFPVGAGSKVPGGSGGLGKLSLLSISFSLMMLGAFTFFGGFLLGLWVGGPTTPSYVPNAGETPPLGLLTPQNRPLASAAQPQGGGVAQGLRSGAQSIGFGNIAAGQAGYEAQSAVTGVRVPGVPSFLSPLVTATQYAVGQQLGYKAQQKVGQQLNQPPSSPQPQAAPAPIQQLPVQPQVPPSPPQTAPVQQPLVSPDKSGQPISQESREGYTIQLGKFAAQENAQALVNQLQALNYTSRIDPGKGTDGRPVYLVNSGLYNTYQEASDAASQFASLNLPGALIVKVSPNTKGGS